MQTDTKSIQTAVKFFMIHFRVLQKHMQHKGKNENEHKHSTIHYVQLMTKVIKLLIINDIII